MREADQTIETADEVGRTTRAGPRAEMDDLSLVPGTTKTPRGALYAVRRATGSVSALIRSNSKHQSQLM